jgi:hypothetical protein
MVKKESVEREMVLIWLTSKMIEILLNRNISVIFNGNKI